MHHMLFPQFIWMDVIRLHIPLLGITSNTFSSIWNHN